MFIKFKFIYWSISIAEIKSCTSYSFYIILLHDSCYNIWIEFMLKYEKRDRARAEITGRDHLGRAEINGRDYLGRDEITGRDHLGRAEITRAEIVEGRDHRTPYVT